MTDYLPSKIVDMILISGECHGNYAAASRLYAERFPDRTHPTNLTISTLTERARNGILVHEHTYIEFLRDHLPGLLENVDLATRQRMWLQQDGALPHFALIVRDRAEVSDVYSDEKFLFSFMDGLCQNFNKNRFNTSLTFLNAISCSKNQKVTEHSLILS